MDVHVDMVHRGKGSAQATVQSIGGLLGSGHHIPVAVPGTIGNRLPPGALNPAHRYIHQ